MRRRYVLSKRHPGAPATSAGLFADPAIAPDYLLVLDFGRWILGVCDSVNILRNDGGTWVEIPRPVAEPLCPSPTWQVSLSTAPPCGGCILPTGEVEFATPWEVFECAGCPPLDPAGDFRWTAEVNRGMFFLDYMPSGPVEDVMSEAVAGTWTTTSDSCATPGAASTLCEIADGSTDAFIPPSPQGVGGGRIAALTLQRNDSGSPTATITLTWAPSCSATDTDYEIYEGEIGAWYSHISAACGTICSTGGATSATFAAAAGDHYYLVVPRDNIVEGSYGSDSDGLERPASTAPCVGQSLGSCPGR
jgi:hypothetical protein